MAKKSPADRRTKGQALKVDFSPMPVGLKLATARFGDAIHSLAFLAAFCLHRYQHSARIVRGGDSPQAEAYTNFELCLSEGIERALESRSSPKFFTDISRFLHAFDRKQMPPRHPLAHRLLEAYSKTVSGRVFPPYSGEIVKAVAPVTEDGCKSEKRALRDLKLRFHDRLKLRSALASFRRCKNKSSAALAEYVFSVVAKPLDLEMPDLWECLAFAHGIDEVWDVGRPTYKHWAHRIANHASTPCGPVTTQLVDALTQELRAFHSKAFSGSGPSIAGTRSTIGIGFRAQSNERLSTYQKQFPLLLKVCTAMEHRLLQEVGEELMTHTIPERARGSI